MAALAAPVVIIGLEQLAAWLGIAILGVAATKVTMDLIDKSNVHSKMKQWAKDHAAQVEADLKKNEPREPTPFTHPPLFANDSIENRKVYRCTF